jgi:hypothetical protein
MFAQEKPRGTERAGAFRKRIGPLAAVAGGFCWVKINSETESTAR